jgi:hypothetical protein
MYCKPDSAAGIYRQITSGLEQAARDGQRIRRGFVHQLILKHGVTCSALMYKVDLIVTFFAEKK